ncbi:MAG TPA: CAP domain-containing protein [Pseudonocardiaceae bacterium]|nr:CAP domain-containing protein [Pseudonocardiaceae bacterium]
MTTTTLKQKMARASVGVLAAGLIIGQAAQASAGTAVAPVAHTSVLTASSAAPCEHADTPMRPRSAYSHGHKGYEVYKRDRRHIASAVLCLVNAERQAANLPVFPGTEALRIAAKRHANESVAEGWWGKATPGKNCRPVKDQSGRDTDQCDPHYNPQTGSTAESRISDTGYVTGCTSWWIGENAYVGWGPGKATARAAVDWWMHSPGHRTNILNPKFTDMGAGVNGGSADPDGAAVNPSGTFVQDFGHCDR